MVRKERLELSHPKILEPKSSASTNSATSAYQGLQISWLGYKDLNLGMTGSKPAALPLGYIPTNNFFFTYKISKMVATTGFEPVTPSL